jgi:hypothetical protein
MWNSLQHMPQLPHSRRSGAAGRETIWIISLA